MQSLIDNQVGGAQREKAMLDEVASGYVPAFLGHMVGVPVASPDGKHSGVIRVTPDYFAVGRDDDYVRISVQGTTAQQIANLRGVMLPTRRMTHAIYFAATQKLAPIPLPAGPQMTSVSYLLSHNAAVQSQLSANHATLGELVAGDKKDLLLSGAQRNGKITIGGWQRGYDWARHPETPSLHADGNPIQDLTTVHDMSWADYSQGCRFVDKMMTVDGAPMPVSQVLADPELAPMVSDEGVIDFTSITSRARTASPQ